MVLSIVIPTYNGKHLLEKNLPFLFDALGNIKKESQVIIVDNGSTDGTEALVKKLTGSRVNGLKEVHIKYIIFQTNKGFTGAVNEGVKNALGTYILILNNDCRLKKDTISKMVDFLEKHKEYVSTQPIVYKLKIETEEIVENIGYVIDLYRGRVEVIKDEKSIKDKVRVLSIKKNIFSQRFLYGLSATCLLIRRDIFLKLGMFDESFHSYLEDIDLFIRLAKHNYQYYPTLLAKCLHDHMATSAAMGNYKEKQDMKNWIRIILKNYPFMFILRHFPALCVERLRNISGLIKKTTKMIQ